MLYGVSLERCCPPDAHTRVLDIMNRKARLAWEAYLKMETSADSYHLLQLLANDCYKVSLLNLGVPRLA